MTRAEVDEAQIIERAQFFIAHGLLVRTSDGRFVLTPRGHRHARRGRFCNLVRWIFRDPLAWVFLGLGIAAVAITFIAVHNPLLQGILR